MVLSQNALTMTRATTFRVLHNKFSSGGNPMGISANLPAVTLSAVVAVFSTAVMSAEKPGEKAVLTEQGDEVLTSIGSDTMIYLVSFWTIEYKNLHPRYRVSIVQAGSATAPPALLSGEADIGPMSRKMKHEEIEAFTKKYGYPPTEIRVALDTLAVYVNRNNPVPGLTIPQVDAIFSSSRRCGALSDIVNWGQLGLGGEWANREIALTGRNLLSGTRAFFAEHALCKGAYKSSLKMKTTSTDVVSTVSWQGEAIGYSGVGYAKPTVRVVPLAMKTGEPFVEATPQNALNGRYPLTRSLYIYVNKPPGQLAPGRVRAFIEMALSARGQEMVAQDGFVPLTPEMTRVELAKLDR